MYQQRARRRGAIAPGRRPYLIGDVGGTAAVVGSAVGTATGIPGGTIVGGIIGNLFGAGNATDQARQRRVAWTLQQANAGSPTAAALILAAPANVSEHEAPYWRTALNTVSSPVLTQAMQQYGNSGFWDQGGPDFYASGPIHQKILTEVSQAGGGFVAPTSPSPVSIASTVFPTTSHGGSLFTPQNLLLGGGIAAAIYFATRPRSRRRR